MPGGVGSELAADTELKDGVGIELPIRQLPIERELHIGLHVEAMSKQHADARRHV